MQDIPQPLCCLADYERAALAGLDEARAAYLTGGAGDEVTAAANGLAFDRIALVPRVLRRVAGGSLACRLLGEELAHPLIVAPLGFLGLAHPDAEPGTALAATAQDARMVLSCQSSTSMEAVREAGSACRWFQLYMQPAREATLALVRRAENAGFTALVITVDAPVSGVRTRQMRSGFRLPQDITAVNLEGLPAPSRPVAAGSAVFDGLMADAPDWGDIAWLRDRTSLKVILKGILAPADAEEAIGIGADAIVVSNHGGRVLDTAVPTAVQLPDIVAAVAGRIPVLMDGGVRRGTDVVKALAMGAAAVMIGRPVVHGLAVGGARGVAHVLRLLRDETEVALALCGCGSVADLSADLLRPGSGLP